MSHLLTSATADRYAEAVHDTVEAIATRLRGIRQPFSGASRDELQSLVDAADLDGDGVGTRAAMAEIDEVFAANAVWFHDPGYLAHLNCPVALPAVAAEAVLAAINTSVDTYDQSTIGTLLERRLIDWTAGRIGFGADGASSASEADAAPAPDGVFTSGGTQSNLQALLLARESTLARIQAAATAASATASDADTDDASGTTDTRRPALLARMSILATENSHFSVQKSALLLGLADDAVVSVPTDAAGRLDPAALRASLAAVTATGRIPMAVVATAGTTDRGMIDPLAEIADAAHAAGAWMHVDAAYGCGLLVSREHRQLLAGVERADSVTVDYHKSFFQPVSSSALIVRDGRELARIAWHADYLNPLANAEPNQVDKSLQTTRRLDALKLWATLRALGADELGRMFDTTLATTQRVHARLSDDEELRLLSPTQLSTVIFRWQPEGVTDAEADRLVPLVRRVLFDAGRVLVAKTVIDGRPALKLTLLNPETSAEQVLGGLELVRAAAAALHDTGALDALDLNDAELDLAELDLADLNPEVAR
ncbi:pyridoxal phosphate-dependent decarboxylase family protein [Schumannella soli]|uniref:Aminotransferase class V-fold PLP-dependent enzyme n=1 Tax=Schumannella soli TaxID=2590779 RepID=A0A506Y6C0_9MICO|nr:aminotransferase class V-fold PLP-dependent enzyme [Schumannella soli]TPW77572.1 aminotransferase class V-fold PLP-dependent enzyme [Schumannella soli]